MAKLTFSLDAETVATLRTTAVRLRKPQSMVVREAIAHYASLEDLTSPAERERILRTIAEIKTSPPAGSREDAVREIADIRRARRASGLHREKRLKKAIRRAARVR